MAYFVIHFMPDPMSVYQCSIDSCSELNNKVCVYEDETSSESPKDTSLETKCESMEKNLVPWSDGKKNARTVFILNVSYSITHISI
jgi:hypothetical protein